MVQPAKIANLPLLALSMIVLSLEVLQSRLVAYSVQNFMIYAVVGIAMLGFGAAGSLVAVRAEWLQRNNLATALAWSATGFAASIVVAHALFVRLTPYLLNVNAVSLGIAALLGLPYLAAGTVVTLALSATESLGAAYAANLIGSGLGCFLPLWLLGTLSAEKLLGLLGILAWLSSLPYMRAIERRNKPLLAANLAALITTVIGFAFAPSVFPIQPDPPPVGQLKGQYEYAAAHGIGLHKRYDRWNPTGRIEILQFTNVPGGPDPYHAMFYAQDSTAGSTLFRWDGRSKRSAPPAPGDSDTMVSRLCSETLYSQGYFSPRHHVLVIGLGGGPDLQCALYQEAEKVDVVEINPDSIAAIRGPLNDWVGGIGGDARVTFHNRDGRSFIHDQPGQFDLIQLSGVDTKNNMASGSLALSENLLYTEEAFRDYLRSLSSDGVLSIIRFGAVEALRLANTAVQALRAFGVRDPQAHIAIARTGVGYGVLVRRKPWTAADADRFDRQLHPPDFRGMRVFYYSQNGLPFEEPAVIEYLPPRSADNAFGAFFAAVARNEESRHVAQLPWDISPTTDDRPFFFDILRYDRAESWSASHVITLRNLLLSVLGLSLLLILLPLRKVRGTGAATVAEPIYFAAVGLGFVLIEVWLLHRFTTYLGHQVYSLSIVLSSLLIATGLGATLGTRAMRNHGSRAIVGCVSAALISLLSAWLAPQLLEATWHHSLPIRAAITIACIAPVGLCLGQPFVAGLGWLRERNAHHVPWCVGINGFCSVIGSVGVIPLLMAEGYSGSLAAGASFYLIASLSAFAMRATSRVAA